MRIEHNDICALIEAAGAMTGIARDLAEFKSITMNDTKRFELSNMYLGMAHHCRKVYMLLLWAEQQPEFPLWRLCNEGAPDTTSVNAAIDALCPLAFTVVDLESLRTPKKVITPHPASPATINKPVCEKQPGDTIGKG